MYRKNLKIFIKNKLMCYNDKTSNMNTLIVTNIKLNNNLYERFLKKRNFESRKKFNIYKNY